MRYKKALAALLAVSMLGAVGCGVKNTDKEDAEKITEATEGFVTALKTDDAQLAASLTDGFDLMADTELDRELWGDDYDIIMHSLSFIEIAEFGEVEFDREDNTAVMSTTFSFLDLDSMIADLPTEYLTHDEWISAMDECDERSEKTFSSSLMKRNLSSGISIMTVLRRSLCFSVTELVCSRSPCTSRRRMQEHTLMRILMRW